MGMIPVPFIDTFKNQIRTSSMVTRRSSMYFQRSTAFEKCKQSISYFGPSVWNSVPIDVKIISEIGISSDTFDSNSENLNQGRSILKKFTKRMKKYALENVTFI